MEVGRSISYRVGDDDETPLVIVTDDLGKNLSDKGMKVEGFRDASLTLPTPIFVETRFQAGNYNANPQTQYTSWNTIDGFQEPNDCCSSESNEENYAHIWWNGLWNDLYSGAELPFIVEFEYNTDSLGDDYIFLGLFDGHSYFMSKGRNFSWGESREIAISLGGYLVSINTQEEQDQIVEWFESLPFEDNEYGPWIGLFQDPTDPLYSEPSGGWRWDDGSSLNYFDRQQANSSFLKGESAPGKTFRLGHGINNIQSVHRRVFFTVLAIEEELTKVNLSELGEGWEHVLGDDQDYVIDDEGNYTFFLNQYQTHAFALDNVPGTPEENLDALVGALLESDKNIIVNVGFWGGSNSWQGNGRDIGFDQIKPIDNVSNEYIFLRAAGDINILGNESNTNEYAVIVAHEDNTRLWVHKSIEDTVTTSPDYVINKGEYQILYFGGIGVSSDDQIYLISNKRVYGYQNMAGQNGTPAKQAMMLVNGINPLASNKIDGIYNIEDIASTKFEMSLKILTSTDAELILNGEDASVYSPLREEIIGREDFSWYYFDNNDLGSILPLGPNKRLTIESSGPVYGQYYGYNSVQGLAGYFFAYSDFDKDGITDADDLDDDNDGILDVWEGDTDTDGDGFLNRYDLDSDGDGCYDTQEAGYTDQDDNGILGYGTSQGVYVDDRGRVIQNNDKTDVVDGYTLPVDLDNSGAEDFREKGFQLEITAHPEDITLEPCPDLDQNSLFFEADANGVNVSYRWQVSTDQGVTWKRIMDVDNYSGIIEYKLEIVDFDTSMIGNSYRAIVETRGYVCGENDTTNAASIYMLPDNDKDCVPDEIDLDDDNDGIYDSEEGDGDIDGDGIINSFDLDTDSDGCFDVIEAGYLDDDEDGLSGLSPVEIDSLGRVIVVDSTGLVNLLGYGEPQDLDENGIKDYKEISENPVIISDPQSVEIALERTVLFSVEVDYDGPLSYQWQLNLGEGWINLADTSIYSGINSDTLVIKSVELAMDENLYRVVISSLLVCSEPVFSDDATLNVLPDNDKDKIPDIYDLDDDNDGILDTDEGESDLDGDGILGVGIPEIDGSGLVITEDDDGYEEPVDSDNNGILDCYDALVLVVDINSQPQYAGTVFQGDDVSYAVGVTVDGDLPAEYQWQRGVVSDDEQDTTWTDLENGLDYTGVDTDSMTINTVTFDDDDNTLYRVKVTAKGYKCAFVLSDPVVLDVKFRDLHIPQGISPNNDGTNDTWVITGIDFYPNNTVQIYNRWELKVFEMEGYENEDPSKYFEGIANYGNTSGKLLPETVYFYVIDLGETDIDGNAVEEDNRYRKGFVYIRRGNE